MKIEKENIASLLFVLCFIAFIFIFAILNIGLIIEPLDDLMQKKTDFSGFVEEIQSAYLSDELNQKDSFLNLNGAFARAMGRRLYNDVVLLDNGMLTQVYERVDVFPFTNNISVFSNYLENSDIPFLYVQAPSKLDANNELMPEHIESYANANADDVLSALQNNDVDVLDLRPYLSETPDLAEQYFFRTDHHWNYTGAFLAFQKITERVQSLFPEQNINMEYTELEQWEAHTLEDWFLGSRGKRVGTLYGGVDDLIYYTPKFETSMSCTVPKHSVIFKGDFMEANIRSVYIEEKNYFDHNAYCLYIGGEYPLVQHRNLNAPSKLRVLIIKDSYTLPVQAFMSTVFSEVDVIDPRHYSECGVAEYVSRYDPDVVLMISSEFIFDYKQYWDFGVEAVRERDERELMSQQIIGELEMDIAANTANYNYVHIAEPLNFGTTYALRFDSLEVLSGQTDGVTVALYNQTTKQILSTMLFDVAYCNAAEGYEWIFSTPDTGEGELYVLLYSGIAGKTGGIQVTYKGVELRAYLSVSE